MSKNNLPPCKWCGKSVAREVEDFRKPEGMPRFSIVCAVPYGGCSMGTPDQFTREAAVAYWMDLFEN